MNKMKLLFFSLFAFFFIFAMLMLRPFGSPQRTAMDEYIIANSQKEAACNNAVTAVVFDYRGFDTLGESTVLFAAVSGVFILFRR
ncbi:MAG: hydrogen gas-evolving membrane-bound hydrogenase subunit E, partial [Candidatus Diapherotrites archaeon]